MTEGVSVEGIDTLDATLGDLADALSDLSTPGLDAAQAALDAATPNVPYKSGALADSGKVVGDGAMAGVFWDEPYAGVILNGWPAHNITAQPWIDPDQTTDVVTGVFTDYVQAAVDQVRGA